MSGYRKPWRLFFSVVKETLPFIIITFAILTTLVFIQQVGKYSNIILSFQTSAQITSTFMISLIPAIVIITLPVSLLLGTVIACSRLSSDSELIAAQSVGISKLSLAFPFIFFGLIGTLFSFYLSSQVSPQALKRLKSLREKILLDEASNQIRPHIFITSFPNVLLYVQDVDRSNGDWLGVFILQQDPARGVSRLLTSERGQLRITSAPRISLEAQLYRGLSLENRFKPQPAAQGGAPSPLPDFDASSQATYDFDKASIKLTEKNAEESAADAPGPINEMTLKEVSRFARSAPNPKDRLKAKVEWHRRLAFSFACLTLTCITYLVSVRGRRFSTRPRTVVAILFIAMGFYLVLIYGQNTAQAGKVAVWLGVWLSNILLGAYIVKSFVTNRQFFNFSALERVFEWLSDAASKLAVWVKGASQAGQEVSKDQKDQKDQIDQAAPAPFRFSLINLVNYLIVSEIAKYYLLALTALVITSIIFTLFDLIPAMAKSGSSLSYTASYLAYFAPQLIYVVSPFAMLVAILTGCSVLTRSNQMVILGGAGLSRLRIISAIMIAAFSLGLGIWFFSDYLLPLTNREQDIRYHRIKSRQLEQTTLAFGKKWVYGKNNIIYSYQRIEPDNTLLNTSIYYLSQSRGVLEKTTHFAHAAQVSPTGWIPADGWTDLIKADLKIERQPAGAQPIRIEDGPALFKRTVNESSKMSAEDLADYIRQLKGVGIATTDLQIDLIKRIAFPFSCLTLAFLGVPFAMARRNRRVAPLVSVAIGVGISLIFWLLMTLFEAAGKQSSLPVSLAVWGPQILFLALAMYLNLRHRSQ